MHNLADEEHERCTVLEMVIPVFNVQVALIVTELGIHFVKLSELDD
jgi:hypothetical protein